MAQAVAETRVVHTVCSHDCPDSCGVLVTVDTASGRAVKVQGDPAHPVTRGFLCGKVAKYLDRVYSPDRLLYPMRRRPGVAKGPLAKGREAEAFERIGWDEALDGIAARLKAVAAEFGPEAVLPYSYAGTIGQLGYGSMDRRFFHRLGASQLDRTICASAGGAALLSVYGIKLGTPPEDFAHARLIIAWGANIHGNNIHLWPFIEEARRAGARLVVIDPYRTRTAALADEHLAIRPGTDGLLALGLMHVILREGLEDAAYVAAATEGFAELKAHALRGEHAPEAVAAATGIAAETIVRMAREYATTRPAVIRLNYGVQRSENGGTTARAVCMLPLLTGAWQRRGGGLQLSTSGSFPFNAAALQMPELMLASELGRPARVVNMSELGQALTTLGQEADSSASLRNDKQKGNGPQGDGPPVKALFVYNCNAAAVAPNQNAVLRGLRREDLFTVVHEQFFTDTADYADVLLPAPTFLETKDVQGAYGHLYVQVSEQAIAPLGEARSNVALFGELGRRMFPESCFEHTEDELIDQALRTDDPWFAGIDRARLEREGQVRLELPENERGEALPFSTAAWFRTPSGRGELTPVPVFVAPRESRSRSEKYPLEFLPRKADNYMNSTFANLPGHRKMEARTAGVLEMHPTDAASRGLATGDAVEVFNGRGRIRLAALVGAQVPAGVVAARLDWNKLSADGMNVNALTSETLTDLGGGATFYSTLVEVQGLGISFEGGVMGALAEAVVEVVGLPGLAEIEAAAEVVYGHMPATPQYSWPLLNARAGAEVWVKHENHTPVGAFKIRGGIVYMDWLRRARPEVTTVVSATRGNHGQSMAYAGAHAGLRVVIVVPHGNSREKNRAMRALGAELVEFGEDFQAASDHAVAQAAEHGWHRVPSYDPLLVTGVATYALEMLRGCPPLETVYVPIGMGSGACGMVAARNALGLGTKIVGVVSSHAPAYALSRMAGEIVEAPAATAIADGVACSKPDPRAFAVVQAGVDRIVAVDDEAVEAAMRAYFADTHNVAEGAGAIGLAALLQERGAGGRRVGTVLCGGNVDSDMFAAVLGRG